MKASRKALMILHWKFVRTQGLNCEVWKKGDMLILWNRETWKIYRLI